MIKINLIREGGRAAARSGGGGGAAGSSAPSGPRNLNDILLVAVAVLGLLAAAGYGLWKMRERDALKEQVAKQRIEAQKLEKIIREVEEFQARKDSLEKRIQLINALKKNQKGPVRLLDRISQNLPDLVWLDRMTLEGTKVELSGRALNPNAFANYVENIKADPMFDEPEVSGVQQAGNSGGPAVYSWGMSFNFTYAPPPEETPAADPAAGAEATATDGSAAPAAGR